jgi:hypothetical protein
MIYWLLFNFALLHCTIKVATHKYRSTAVHDVSITNSFSAFNCVVFNSTLYVCYMWHWVMWRIFWLCWMETLDIWISITQTLLKLINWDQLRLCSVQSVDTGNNTFNCRNGKYFILWMYQLINTLHNGLHRPLLQQQHHCLLETLNAMFSKWTVQSVHLHNIQLNSHSTWLHSHSWIEEFDVDIWMQKLYIYCKLYVNI